MDKKYLTSPIAFSKTLQLEDDKKDSNRYIQARRRIFTPETPTKSVIKMKSELLGIQEAMEMLQQTVPNMEELEKKIDLLKLENLQLTKTIKNVVNEKNAMEWRMKQTIETLRDHNAQLDLELVNVNKKIKDDDVKTLQGELSKVASEKEQFLRTIENLKEELNLLQERETPQGSELKSQLSSEKELEEEELLKSLQNKKFEVSKLKLNLEKMKKQHKLRFQQLTEEFNLKNSTLKEQIESMKNLIEKHKYMRTEFDSVQQKHRSEMLEKDKEVSRMRSQFTEKCQELDKLQSKNVEYAEQNNQLTKTLQLTALEVSTMQKQIVTMQAKYDQLKKLSEEQRMNLEKWNNQSQSLEEKDGLTQDLKNENSDLKLEVLNLKKKIELIEAEKKNEVKTVEKYQAQVKKLIKERDQYRRETDDLNYERNQTKQFQENEKKNLSARFEKELHVKHVEITKLKETLTKAQSESANFKRRYDEIVEKSDNQNQEFKEKLNHLQGQAQEENDRNISLQKENEEIKQTLESQTKEINRLSTNLSKLQNEGTTNSKELDVEIKRYKKEIANLLEEKKRQKNKLLEMKKDFQSVKDELKQTQERAQHDLDNAAKQIESLEEKSKGNQKKLIARLKKETARQLEEEKFNKAELELKMKNMEREHQNKLKSFKNEVKSLKGKIDSLKQDNSLSKQQVSELKEDVKRLNADREKEIEQAIKDLLVRHQNEITHQKKLFDNDLNLLQEKLSEKEKFANELKKHQNETVDHYEESLSQLDAKIQSLESIAKAHEKLKQNYKNLKSKFEKIKNDSKNISDLEAINEKMMKEKETAIEKLQKEVSKVSSERSSMEKQFHAEQQKVKTFSNRDRVQSSVIDKLKQDLSNATSKLNEYQSKNHKEYAEFVKKHEDNIKKLREDMQTSEIKIQAIEKEKQSLSAQLITSEKEMESLRQEAETWRKESVRQSGIIEDFENQLSLDSKPVTCDVSVQSSNHDYEEKVKSLQEKLVTLERSSEAEISTLKSNVDQLIQTNNEMKKTLNKETQLKEHQINDIKVDLASEKKNFQRERELWMEEKKKLQSIIQEHNQAEETLRKENQVVLEKLQSLHSEAKSVSASVNNPSNQQVAEKVEPSLDADTTLGESSLDLSSVSRKSDSSFVAEDETLSVEYFKNEIPNAMKERDRDKLMRLQVKSKIFSSELERELKAIENFLSQYEKFSNDSKVIIQSRERRRLIDFLKRARSVFSKHQRQKIADLWTDQCKIQWKKSISQAIEEKNIQKLVEEIEYYHKRIKDKTFSDDDHNLKSLYSNAKVLTDHSKVFNVSKSAIENDILSIIKEKSILRLSPNLIQQAKALNVDLKPLLSFASEERDRIDDEIWDALNEPTKKEPISIRTNVNRERRPSLLQNKTSHPIIEQLDPYVNQLLKRGNSGVYKKSLKTNRFVILVMDSCVKAICDLVRQVFESKNAPILELLRNVDCCTSKLQVFHDYEVVSILLEDEKHFALDMLTTYFLLSKLLLRKTIISLKENQDLIMKHSPEKNLFANQMHFDDLMFLAKRLEKFKFALPFKVDSLKQQLELVCLLCADSKQAPIRYSSLGSLKSLYLRLVSKSDILPSNISLFVCKGFISTMLWYMLHDFTSGWWTSYTLPQAISSAIESSNATDLRDLLEETKEQVQFFSLSQTMQDKLIFCLFLSKVLKRKQLRNFYEIYFNDTVLKQYYNQDALIFDVHHRTIFLSICKQIDEEKYEWSNLSCDLEENESTNFNLE